MKHIYILFIGLIAFTINAKAQHPKVVADKIIAQVGDRIILKSTLTNAIADYKRQGQEANLPPDPECAFLEGQLIQKALMLQAEKDSVKVSDDEVEAEMDNRIRGLIREVGSQQAVEEIFGRSIFQVKETFKQDIKDGKLAEQMKSKIVSNVKITPNEVKAHFEKTPKDSLPFYESELELLQIIAYPKANADVDSYIVKQLNDYKRQAETGVRKFEQLAMAYTEDPGSKATGGQYTINRNDKNVWDATFYATCFKLKEGQISNVIKSKFGYHIIQLVARNGDDAIVRHILRIAPVTQDEIDITIKTLDTVKQRLEKKEINFGDALSKYGDDERNKNFGGAVVKDLGSSFLTIDQLDKEMIAAIEGLKPGQYAKPQVFTDFQGQKRVRLVYLKTRTEPHRENLKQDYPKISQRALQEKISNTLAKWFADRLPNFYIKIDESYKDCSALAKWYKYTAK